MAASLNLRCYNGEDVEFDGTHTVSATDPTPIDITGWHIEFKLRLNLGDTNLVLDVSASIVDGPTGKYAIALTDVQTAALGVGRFVADIWRTDAGAQTEMAIGTLIVLQSVHNSLADTTPTTSVVHASGEIWVECVGVSPNRVCTTYIQDGDTAVALSAVTY